MTDEQIAAANFLYGEPQVTREQLIERLLAAEARERILQLQNDAFDVMGADLSARIAALEKEAREVVHMLDCGKVTGIALAAKRRLAEVLER